MNITNLFSECYKRVRKLQIRIAKAVQKREVNKAKKLGRILTRSIYAKILSVWKVINNKGGRTPGVDKVVWTKETDLFEVAKTLKQRGYHPLPLRRIYILKRNGKKRPLGIPTMKDRAMQALHLLALEPVAETVGDKFSYGFRKYRSCRDAIKYLYTCLSRKNSATWVLEADIRGCFDNINHDWLLKHIPIDKQILRKWLKCGFIENNQHHPTTAGTPQGGIISPALMNLTLDGLGALIKKKYPIWRNYLKVNFVRYADDFVITAVSKELIETEIIPLVTEFLAERGLTLSSEKTKITHITEGFDFLSQNTRKYPNGKLFQMPSDKAVCEIKHKLRDTVFKNLNAKPNELILQLNSILRGWTNYHKHIVSKEIFKTIDYYLWRLLGKWCKRRHANKPWKWIRAKYFTASEEACSFASVTRSKKGNTVRINKIFRAGRVPIIRHTIIDSTKNCYLKTDEQYFINRRRTLQQKSLKTKQNCIILKKIKETQHELLTLWNVEPVESQKKPLRNARAV